MKTQTLFLIALLIGLSFLCSCDNFNNESGYTKEEVKKVDTVFLNFDPFEIVYQRGAQYVEIKYGEIQEVKVVGPIDAIHQLNQGVIYKNWNIFTYPDESASEDLKIYITLPFLSQLMSEGSGPVILNNINTDRSLQVNIRNSGKVILSHAENLEELSVLISGTGNFSAEGENFGLNNLEISINGAGSFYGFPISTRFCDVHNNGTGSIFTSVLEQMDVTIDNKGSVYYKGYPVIGKRITGSGKLINNN